MTFLGFKTVVIKWFKSFHTNKKLFVSLNDVFSKAGIINHGVPHGSFLGPLLFLINFNDLPQLLSKSALIFMLIIQIFSTKTKAYTKLKMSYIRNPLHSVNGLLIKGYQFILGKKKQNALSFLKISVCQS